MTTFIVLLVFVGLAGGVIGKLKGSSFWLWALVSVGTGGMGILAAVLYRNEAREPRRECPTCGQVVLLSDQVCMRCGTDLFLPPDDEVLAPLEVERRAARTAG